MFFAAFNFLMSLVDKGFHFYLKGSGYYDSFIFQKDTFTEYHCGEYKLILGKNPKLPYTLSDELPVLTIKPTSPAIQENLTAIHTA